MRNGAPPTQERRRDAASFGSGGGECRGSYRIATSSCRIWRGGRRFCGMETHAELGLILVELAKFDKPVAAISTDLDKLPYTLKRPHKKSHRPMV